MSRKPKPAPAPIPRNLPALIKLEKEKRSQICLDELTAVLKKHNCTWDAQLFFRGGRMQGVIEIVALDVAELRQEADAQ